MILSGLWAKRYPLISIICRRGSSRLGKRSQTIYKQSSSSSIKKLKIQIWRLPKRMSSHFCAILGCLIAGRKSFFMPLWSSCKRASSGLCRNDCLFLMEEKEASREDGHGKGEGPGHLLAKKNPSQDRCKEGGAEAGQRNKCGRIVL